MVRYIIVLGRNKPTEDSCNYLSEFDKDGMEFTHDIDDAITFIDKDSCELVARGLSIYRSLDVYSVKEKTVRSFEYVW